MKLASLETITKVFPHPNADALEQVSVLGFTCAVRKVDGFKEGDLVAFIQPDTVLPDADWSVNFKKGSNRVKAIKLRKVWSEGLVMRPETMGIHFGPEYVAGEDISEKIGVTKYNPPAPQDLNAKGPLPFGIPKTDEERFNNIENLPFGELVDVTLKVDGQSFSAYRNGNEMGVCGRTMEYKLDSDNHFTRNFKQLNLEEKLVQFGGAACFRGEQFGQGIQKNDNNPHAKLPVGVQFFSVWLIDERRYAYKGDPNYAFDLFPKLGLPSVMVLERDVILTPELIKKYSEDLTTVNGVPFEGVVIQHSKGSFKCINKDYDSKK